MILDFYGRIESCDKVVGFNEQNFVDNTPFFSGLDMGKIVYNFHGS